jgi:hypothetical protein
MISESKIKQAADMLAKKLSDEGRLIEAGWLIFKHLTIQADAPDVQIREMRLAFMAGAQHLFSSIIGMLDSSEEPTDADIHRMYLINKELEAVHEELELRYGPTEGSA